MKDWELCKPNCNYKLTFGSKIDIQEDPVFDKMIFQNELNPDDVKTGLELREMSKNMKPWDELKKQGAKSVPFYWYHTKTDFELTTEVEEDHY